MTTGRSARDVCLGVLDGAEAHDYGSDYGSPGVARIDSPQAARLTTDLLAALTEAGYVVVRAENAAPVVTDEMVALAEAAWNKAYWSERTPSRHDWFRAALEAVLQAGGNQ